MRRDLSLHLGRLQESAGAAYAALYDSPESALVLARLDFAAHSTPEGQRGERVTAQRPQRSEPASGAKDPPQAG